MNARMMPIAYGLFAGFLLVGLAVLSAALHWRSDVARAGAGSEVWAAESIGVGCLGLNWNPRSRVARTKRAVRSAPPVFLSG